MLLDVWGWGSFSSKHAVVISWSLPACSCLKSLQAGNVCSPLSIPESSPSHRMECWECLHFHSNMSYVYTGIWEWPPVVTKNWRKSSAAGNQEQIQSGLNELSNREWELALEVFCLSWWNSENSLSFLWNGPCSPRARCIHLNEQMRFLFWLHWRVVYTWERSDAMLVFSHKSTMCLLWTGIQRYSSGLWGWGEAKTMHAYSGQLLACIFKDMNDRCM